MSDKRFIDYGRYEVTRPWPRDCVLQGGGNGMVFGREPGTSYTTAFFEAFPTIPPTFIRGEGATIKEAEDAAWAKYERVTADDHTHEFEARTYRNGAGICKHCDLFQSDVFSPEELDSRCSVCDIPTFWNQVAGKTYCEEHSPSRAEARELRAEDVAAGGAKPSFLEALLDFVDFLGPDDKI